MLAPMITYRINPIRVKIKSIERIENIYPTEQWKFDENRIKTKEDIKLQSFAIFHETFLEHSIIESR